MPAEVMEVAPELKKLVKHLGDNNVFVCDLPKEFNAITLSQAWIQGLVEFGRHNHVVVGRPGPHSEKTGDVLLLEDGINWSGFKRRSHKAMKDLLAEDEVELNFCEYREYAPLVGIDPKTQQPYAPGSFHQVAITADKARKAMRLQIRIADRGFEQLRV